MDDGTVDYRLPTTTARDVDEYMKPEHSLIRRPAPQIQTLHSLEPNDQMHRKSKQSSARFLLPLFDTGA